MKPAELKSRRPSRGFSIDSIIGEPTHNTRRNDTPTISDHNTLCPSPPRNNRETGDKRGIVKPTPTHLPAPTSFRASLAAGKEDRVLPLPFSLPQLLHPHPQFRGKIGAGAEGKMPPGPLALRSVWGMTSALERSSLGVSPGVPPAGSRPALLPQHLSQPVGSLPLPLPLPQGLLNGLSARDSLHHSLHPWLLARHAHCLGYPLFGSAEASFLYQWSRKPKRIRTAFSPGQLLRLEQAFDNNHYVVGQERKELADKLSLTETQVKVWFQNRRTKFKRMKAEEGDATGAPAEQEQEEDEEEANPFPHPRDLDQVSDGDSCSANSQHRAARAVVGQPRGQSVDMHYEPLYTSS